MTHARAEALFLLEAKFAQPLAGPEGLAAWIDDVAVLTSRYLMAGGTFGELHARFQDVRPPLGGRFFLAEDGQ